MKGIHTCI